MITRCLVCSEGYPDRYRGWYHVYVPQVCSSYCFRRYVYESFLPRVIPVGSYGITRFKNSDRSFRSKYELEFARWMRQHKIDFDFEQYKLTLSDKSAYVPDFLVADRVFMEVKGLWTPEGKKKFLLATREFYEHFVIMVADREFLDLLKRTK